MLYNIDLNSLLAIHYICNRSFPGKNSEDRLYKYTHTHMDTYTHGHIHTCTHGHNTTTIITINITPDKIKQITWSSSRIFIVLKCLRSAWNSEAFAP